jgi:hypothetical protein
VIRRLRSGLRSRFTLRRIALALVLVVAFGGLLALIQNDSSESAPIDHAASLVPANVLAYVHVSVRPDSKQWRNANRLAKGFPRLVEARDRFLRSLTARGGRLDPEREVYPWLDDEAALALLAGKGGKARSLILLEVSDRDLATAFLSRAVGRVRESAYRRTPIRTYGTLATAFLGDFLAIGQLDNVRAAIDVRQGRLASLARNLPFNRARAALPNRDRLLFGYATPEGLRRVLETQPGVLGQIARLANVPDLLGAAVTARADKHGVTLEYAGTLQPENGRVSTQLERPYVPQLQSVVPEDAIAFMDMHGADRLFEAIAKIGGGTRLRLPKSLIGLSSEISATGGRPFRRALRPLLGKEAALFLSPSGQAPLLTLVVHNVKSAEAATMIERLQPLIAKLLERPAEGQIPIFQPREIAGVNAVTLTITPSVELTFAVFDGNAVVSTGPEGIRALKSRRSKIANNSFFETGTKDRLDRVTSVLFLDLEQFFAIGEQAGLRGAPSFRAFRSALSRVSAISAVTSGTPSTKTATIFIEVP